MEQLGLGLLGTGLGAGLALLARQTLRAGRARKAGRRAYFDHCAEGLTNPRRGEGSAGFPRLAGQHGGAEFDLQAVPDTLTFRKLPALWVLVTLPAPLPLRATLDLMIRPTGVEPFSHFHSLPDQITPPPGFPEDCALRSDAPEALPPEDILAPHLGLFADDSVKELILSPKGLRITFLAEEANRGRYLIFRDAELGATPLPFARILPHLDTLLSLRRDLLARHDPPRARAVG
ncbi:hypothetical protein [Paracoccus zhejiangensis]|uniref:DUF3137 domain-containing protein n=1 Tax=Paracoccus zhejiangensis TaxID=1077935 RepID=A0A2H5EUR8_9RHOB|nr:hypothetical protein [Paracoccus zhejiangensis]AUH63045.1 hypothetical protein CX676_01785 [Paracoccus zhejiangensis]